MNGDDDGDDVAAEEAMVMVVVRVLIGFFGSDGIDGRSNRMRIRLYVAI